MRAGGLEPAGELPAPVRHAATAVSDPAPAGGSGTSLFVALGALVCASLTPCFAALLCCCWLASRAQQRKPAAVPPARAAPPAPKDAERPSPRPQHRTIFDAFWPLHCRTCNFREFVDVPKHWKCPVCVQAQRKAADVFQDKATALRCRVCRAAFTFMKTSHNCRCCGWAVCNACACEYKAVPGLLLLRPVRVCARCSRLLSSGAWSWLGSCLAAWQPTAKWSKLSDDQLVHEFQALVNATCHAATLGTGRDVVRPGAYSALKVVRVHMVSNPELWAGYEST